MGKLLKAYIQDRLLYIVTYLLSFILITLFYSLTTNRLEFIYPLLIALLLLTTFIIIDAYRYLSFYKNVNKSIKNPQYDLTPTTQEHRIIHDTISSIHEHYLNQLYAVRNKQHENNRFINHWIHTLKTPASVIDVILQENEDQQVDTDIAMKDIKKENQRITHLLEQILSLSRLDDFSKDYHPEEVNLIHLINKQINAKKRQFIYEGIYPKLNTLSEQIIVLTDEKWSMVLLDQILSNAIKYTPKKEGKRIFISVELIDGKAVLSIEDEGIGIPDYDLSRIFEPFFTGKNGRSEKNATGIGLYMCAAIAEKLGHEISIDSTEGKGTRVQISYLTKM